MKLSQEQLWIQHLFPLLLTCPGQSLGGRGWSLGILFWQYLCPASISIGFPVWGAENLLDWDEPAWNGLKNEAHCSESLPAPRRLRLLYQRLDSGFSSHPGPQNSEHQRMGAQDQVGAVDTWRATVFPPYSVCCLSGVFGSGSFGWFCHLPLSEDR